MALLASGTPETIRDADWRKRLEGLVPEQVEQKHVMVVGCGSVGSFVAAELVRSGVRRLTLVDPDVVEWANLTRTVYLHADLGRTKVEALRDHLRAIFPDVDVTTHARPVQDLTDDLDAMLKQANLVIAAVDQPKANGLIDRYCYALNKPVVFIGLYRGAKGGEVIVTQPKYTPCFHCSTGGVRRVVQDAGIGTVERNARDYGTNRLVAEVALGSDIHYVCCAGTKIALSLLADGHGNLAGFMDKKLAEGCNYLMLGMEPDYYLFPSTHATTIGQYAFQSIWATTSRDPECEACGVSEHGNHQP
jgi:hypothetical protein